MDESNMSDTRINDEALRDKVAMMLRRLMPMFLSGFFMDMMLPLLANESSDGNILSTYRARICIVKAAANLLLYGSTVLVDSVMGTSSAVLIPVKCCSYRCSVRQERVSQVR